MIKAKLYTKKNKQAMYPYEAGMNLNGVSISDHDKENGSPKTGDMIAFNMESPSDKWLVAEKFFKENYEESE